MKLLFKLFIAVVLSPFIIVGGVLICTFLYASLQKELA